MIALVAGRISTALVRQFPHSISAISEITNLSLLLRPGEGALFPAARLIHYSTHLSLHGTRLRPLHATGILAQPDRRIPHRRISAPPR